MRRKAGFSWVAHRLMPADRNKTWFRREVDCDNLDLDQASRAGSDRLEIALAETVHAAAPLEGDDRRLGRLDHRQCKQDRQAGP